MTVLVPIRKGFPRPGIVTIPRRRGVGDWGDFSYDPISVGTNLATGTLSGTQLLDIQQAAAEANKQAATIPGTQVVNQALLDEANTQMAAETAAAANVSNISTGSWISNLTDNLQGTFTGKLGLPGFTPPLGTTVPVNPGGGIDWTSILETIALYGGLGLGAYLLLKKILR